MRRLRRACGLVLRLWSFPEREAAGILSESAPVSGPASINKTRLRTSLLRWLAKTQPADPAPIMM